MKTLAIYFSDPKPMGYPFNVDEPYFKYYQTIVTRLESVQIQVVIVRGKSYLGCGLFSHGWKMVGNKLTLIKNPIKADLIWNRDDKNTIPKIFDCPIINHPDLDELCVDKVATAKLFPKMSPCTLALDSFDQLNSIIKKWQLKKEDKIVLKKNFQTSGRGIHIIPVGKISKKLYRDWKDILIQEFIDSTRGIPEIVKGLHDIRIVTLNGKIINSFFRTPKKGSFLANVALGGTEHPVNINKLPVDLVKKTKIINLALKKYRPSLFSCDFMNSKNSYKLVELNSRPGLIDPGLSPFYQQFYDELIKLLVKLLG